MKHTSIERVLLMAHGWGYNHRFFDAFLSTLPANLRSTTLFACLEAGYFPEQAKAGLLVQINNEWIQHPVEALHSLVLAHAEVPWLGLGHSLGFSKLLNFAVRWHSLFSVHGFTHFTQSDKHTEGTAPRILARMVHKAEQNMAAVLSDFHTRCGYSPQWGNLNEQALLSDLASMQYLDCANGLVQALTHGAVFHAWAGSDDAIAPLPLQQACFQSTLSDHGHALHTVEAQHAGFANTPARYTGTLLPLLSQH